MDSTASSQATMLPAIGLAVALGVGLLIGTERERRKGQGDDREVAGLRSFAVAAVCGALAQSLAVPCLVAVGALLVAMLATIAYFKSRSKDPGLTTEMALFVTYLIGVQSAIAPPGQDPHPPEPWADKDRYKDKAAAKALYRVGLPVLRIQ